MNEFEDLLNSVSQVEPGDVVSAECIRQLMRLKLTLQSLGTGVEGVLDSSRIDKRSRCRYQ